MKLSESHLIQLSAVVDAGSVSKGAAMLGLSQPALSRSLAQLEARVGKPLFIRDRRPLQATPLGMQLAAHGRRILVESRRATEAVQSLLRGTRGLVRVGGVPFFMDAMISRIIAGFQNQHPDVVFEQSYGNLTEVGTGLRADQLDLGIVPTCTGYLCPGVTSYVAEKLGLRPDAYLQDLVGLGCGAAIPALRSASALLAANPAATVACVAVEICSAAFYLDDDPGVLVSASLFGDGAAASIWRATPPPAPGPMPALRATGFNTLHLPEARDHIRFEQRFGKLRNLLTPAVPALAADAVARLFAAEPPDQPRPARILSHPGGRDVLDALETALPGYPLDFSRRVLREHQPAPVPEPEILRS